MKLFIENFNIYPTAEKEIKRIKKFVSNILNWFRIKLLIFLFDFIYLDSINLKQFSNQTFHTYMCTCKQTGGQRLTTCERQEILC